MGSTLSLCKVPICKRNKLNLKWMTKSPFFFDCFRLETPAMDPVRTPLVCLWPLQDLCESLWRHFVTLGGPAPRAAASYGLSQKHSTYMCTINGWLLVLSSSENVIFKSVKHTARQREKYDRHVILFVYDVKFHPRVTLMFQQDLRKCDGKENKVWVVTSHPLLCGSISSAEHIFHNHLFKGVLVSFHHQLWQHVCCLAEEVVKGQTQSEWTQAAVKDNTAQSQKASKQS